MLKSDLIQRVFKQNPGLYQTGAKNIVDAIFEEIVTALSHGSRVELRGFGAFWVKRRAARRGRNPRNGAAVAVRQKKVPLFRPGKEMRERLNRVTIKD
jgi:integration host factor subunit beta